MAVTWDTSPFSDVDAELAKFTQPQEPRSMTDIEHLAKALRASDQLDVPQELQAEYSGDSDTRMARAVFRIRAILTALRDPTEGMVTAADKMVREVDGVSVPPSPEECFTTMIDYILGEK